MKRLLLLFLLVGCSSEVDKKHDIAKGELRHKLFIECMELAAKNGRNADDDVHKIVDACNNHSLYLSNSMMP